MKHFLSIFIFTLAICLSNISDVFAETFFEPEWSDFCPNRFKNVNNRWHYTSSGRYWANRRQSFEKNLKFCQNLSSTQKDACFHELSIKEENKTRTYQNEKRNKSLRYFLLNTSF